MNQPEIDPLLIDCDPEAVTTGLERKIAPSCQWDTTGTVPGGIVNL